MYYPSEKQSSISPCPPLRATDVPEPIWCLHFLHTLSISLSVLSTFVAIMELYNELTKPN